MILFSSLVEEIDAAHDRLGHALGWRFLYTPARTLAWDTRLAFVGLNPGGSVYEPPVPSVEAGNAYRLEHWGGGGLNKLQIQIGRFYADLGRRLDQSPTELMDETLAANLCPFRSRSWDELANKDASIAFSIRVWTRVLTLAAPRVAVCLGDRAARHLQEALTATGARSIGRVRSLPVGWGSVTAATAEYERREGTTLVIRLPHLARFGIFGRQASADAAHALTAQIAERMTP